MTALAGPSALSTDGGTTPGAGGPPPGLRLSATRTRAERRGLFALLAATMVLYTWGLGRTGWANGYYSAAVEAGTKSAKAAFFGSLDWGNAITVDKTPASLWVMELSARLFGLSPWSLLLPQALEGVISVAAVYAIVRRYAPAVAALGAGVLMAVTPASALIFRFNNPDALMVMLVLLAAYALLRSTQSARTAPVFLAGALVGVAFLAKELEALLVVPAFAITYLVEARRHAFPARLARLAGGGLAMVAAGGWWPVVVEIIPGRDRPYIGGSTDNSLSSVVLGYNGVGRVIGGEGGIASTFHVTSAEFTRLYDGAFGTEAGWFLPLALLLGLVGVMLAYADRGLELPRAPLLLCTTWLLTMYGVFSFGAGIINAYYTVAMVPPMAVVLAIVVAALVKAMAHREARYALAGSVALTGLWAYMLLARDPAWDPWARAIVLACTAVAGTWCVAGLPRARMLAVGGATATVAAALLGPLTYTLNWVGHPQPGSDPIVGAPAPPGGYPASGSLESVSRPSTAVVTQLREGAKAYEWAAAVVGANPAAGYELSAGVPVMAVGGFRGTDPFPSLRVFQRLVLQRHVHYFIAGGLVLNPQAGFVGSAVEHWVSTHFSPKDVSGTVLYDLAVSPRARGRG